MLCEYGCNQEAKYQLSNGKWCCCRSYNSCPKNREKNSQRRLETSYKIKCEICGNEFSKESINNHKKKCNRIKNLLTSKKKLLRNDEINSYIIKYNKIILFRSKNPLLLTDDYEIHHIQPKCLQGTDNINNLICLTPREHYVCHALLAEGYKNTKFAEKLYCAFFRMSTKDNQKINSRMYEKLKNGYKAIAKKHQTTKNKIIINKDNKNKFIYKEDLDNYLTMGWNKGLIIRNYNPNSSHNKGKLAVYKDNVKKFILPKDLENYVQNGWIYAISSKLQKSSKKQEIWIHRNNDEQRKIKKDKLEYYLQNGWEKGKIHLPMKGRLLINNGVDQIFTIEENLNKYLMNGWKLGGIKGLKAGKPKSFRTKEHCLKLSKSNKGKHNK